MKKYLFFILLFGASNYAFSQGSRVYDNLTVPSEILGKAVQYSVYLPDGYETSHRHYPVVYLLHGGGPFGERHTACALLYAFKHPDLFSSCVALSSAIRTDDEIRAMPLEQYLPRHSTNMGNLKEGEERVTDHRFIWLKIYLSNNSKKSNTTSTVETMIIYSKEILYCILPCENAIFHMNFE